MDTAPLIEVRFGAQAEEAPLDPRALAEAVNIVPRIPSGLQTALMSTKWKERKEVLDELATVLQSSLKIKDAPELHDVVKALAGRMTDANINCVIVAANCLEALAKGLMDGFNKYPLKLRLVKSFKISIKIFEMSANT